VAVLLVRLSNTLSHSPFWNEPGITGCVSGPWAILHVLFSGQRWQLLTVPRVARYLAVRSDRPSPWSVNVLRSVDSYTECGDARTGYVRRCVRGMSSGRRSSISTRSLSWSLRRLVQESVAMPVRPAHGLVLFVSGSSWVCFGSLGCSMPSQSRTNVSVAMPGRVAHGFVRWFFVGNFSAGVLFMLRRSSVLLFFVLCWVFGRRSYTEWRRCPLVIIRPVYNPCAVPTSKLLRWQSCCLCLRSVRVLVLLVGFLSYCCGEGLVVFLLTSPIHSRTL